MPTFHFIDGRTFDPTSGELRGGDRVRRLEPQPAALLTLLASRAGTLVTHAEIARQLWPDGTHVDFQAGVHYAVRQIRAALGDSAGTPRFVETMPRRGYRFRRDALVPPPAAVSVVAARAVVPWRRPRRAVALALAAALVAATLIVERRPNDHHERAVALLAVVHDLVY